MDIIPYLPPLQASLNLISACLIVAAYLSVRHGNKRAHKVYMVTALMVSTLFLLSYLYYHNQVGYMPFNGQGFIRPVYFLLLFSHIILAVVILPMIVLTVVFAFTERITLHQKITRWTLPLWLYVSVTGVLIYLLGFHLYPPGA